MVGKESCQKKVSERARIVIRGAVQGVGFRPFVYRLSKELDLAGWVSNSSNGLFIEVEGDKSKLDRFVLRLENERPERASIQSLELCFLDTLNLKGFEIRQSDARGDKTAFILPDIATCPECIADILDPTNRRHLYPFTNCTNCGPRYTIIEALPYDGSATSMKRFEMCPECRREYQDPDNRRFHAQPNACADCGPQIELWDDTGNLLAQRSEAFRKATDAIKSGQVVALKGLGGFHLMADARNEKAVVRLRERKHREEKPFAVMYPHLEAIQEDCEMSALESRLLSSPEAPIVILQKKKARTRIASSVAPHNPQLGALLPYTPLHHLLLKELGFPVVATSGNVTDEPICIDEREALDHLRGIADCFLVHDRPILRFVDDSVARVVLGRELLLRRARGYAPLPLSIRDVSDGILAVGGDLKSTVALTVESNVFISPHIGDLETVKAMDSFHKTVSDLLSLYESRLRNIVADLHPDYSSTKFALGCDMPLISVQHHLAHIASCIAENEIDDPVLGVAWDGTGYGPDGTIWGGEFLLVNGVKFRRLAHFRLFPLPGGARAIREPRRAALGLLFEMLGEKLFEIKELASFRGAFTETELSVLRQLLRKELSSPRTSSVGRFFDVVAALTGIRYESTYEGQAAMELEYAAQQCSGGRVYPYRIIEPDRRRVLENGVDSKEPMVIDWEPMILEILSDCEEGQSPAFVADRFHDTLAAVVIDVATRAGQDRVVLTGGCFQNRCLIERTVRRLEDCGFHAHWHQRVPPNDGGLCLGQAYVASRMIEGDR